MKNICFAFSENTGCAILTDTLDCGKACAFRKTREEVAAAIERTYARLRTLPLAEQKSISANYYNGKMPWTTKIS